MTEQDALRTVRYEGWVAYQTTEEKRVANDLYRRRLIRDVRGWPVLTALGWARVSENE